MTTAIIRTGDHTIRIHRIEYDMPSDGIYPQVQLGPPTFTIDGEEASRAEVEALVEPLRQSSAQRWQQRRRG